MDLHVRSQCILQAEVSKADGALVGFLASVN